MFFTPPAAAGTETSETLILNGGPFSAPHFTWMSTTQHSDILRNSGLMSRSSRFRIGQFGLPDLNAAATKGRRIPPLAALQFPNPSARPLSSSTREADFLPTLWFRGRGEEISPPRN